MALRKYKIYVDMTTRSIYDRNGAELSDKTNPYIYYKEKLQLQIQYLNKAPDQPPVDATLDKYTDFAGQTITSLASVDNNNYHYYSGTLNTAVSGAVTSIIMDGLTTAPRLNTGTLFLINSAGEQEAVNYTNYSASGTTYTFTVSTTLTYSYASGDEVRNKDISIIESDDSDIDDTDKATGLFLINLDGNSRVFQKEAYGKDDIDGCKFEHQVLDTLGDLAFAIKFNFQCFNLLSDDAVIPPAPDDDYYTKVQVDAIVAGKADKVGADDIEITDATKGIILADRTTATRYRIFIDNGVIGIESL